MGSGIILKRIYKKPTTAIKSLEDYTWAEISAFSTSGTAADHLTIGDTKTVVVDGVSRLVRLIGFDHFETEPYESYAGTVFEFVEPLDELYAFDTSGTTDWTSSSLRTTLNDTFFPTLPEDLQDVIVPVYPWAVRDGSGVAAQCKVFILSVLEYGKDSDSIYDTERNHCTAVAYYADGGTPPWMALTGDEDTIMTRSAVNTEDWAAVTTYDNTNRAVQWSVSYTSSYVCPCFCV